MPENCEFQDTNKLSEVSDKRWQASRAKGYPPGAGETNLFSSTALPSCSLVFSLQNCESADLSCQTGGGVSHNPAFSLHDVARFRRARAAANACALRACVQRTSCARPETHRRSLQVSYKCLWQCLSLVILSFDVYVLKEK